MLYAFYKTEIKMLHYLQLIKKKRVNERLFFMFFSLPLKLLFIVILFQYYYITILILQYFQFLYNIIILAIINIC